MSQTKDLLILFLLALGVQLVLSWPIRQPGTMDAHYYYGSGKSLSQHGAFIEPFIWNYLEPVSELPAPSHLYWMPLPSILVALSHSVLEPTFKSAQIPFIFLAASFPLISYLTSLALSHRRRHAWLAGLLTIFCGFYIPYLNIPETFTPFAIAGGGALYCAGRWMENSQRKTWLLATGVLAGLGHLTRADGVLLLGTALFIVIIKRLSVRELVHSSVLLLAGYLLVMTPWFLRNYQVIGAPLSTAGTQTIFAHNYDELFSYGTPLTLERYLSWGLAKILQSKLEAAWINLQSFAAVSNLIFLAPISFIGLRKTRGRSFIWPSVVFGIMLYASMTFLFTFPGTRGGFFHSSIALLPSVFSVSTIGLDAFVDWVADRRRQWQRLGAKRVFSTGIVLLAMGLSLFVYFQRVIGSGNWSEPAWNQTDSFMPTVGQWIKRQTAEPPIVMVGNPPAFNYHTGLNAIVIPNESIDKTLQAALCYHATFIVLDENHPTPLTSLYQGLECDQRVKKVHDNTNGAPPGIIVYQIVNSK